MNILIDIGHPAHIHYFRNFAGIMEAKGHDVLFVVRDRGFNLELMEFYELTYVSRGRGRTTFVGKLINAIRVFYILFRTARRFKCDILMSQGGIYTSFIGWLLRKPSITFSDTENSKWSHRIASPFTSVFLTPDCFGKNLGKKQISYNGVMELAYLDGEHFRPDSSILNKLKVKNDEKYVLIRFVSWNAHHDSGHEGMSLENKIRCVTELSNYAKVFITSEDDLPDELKKYKIEIPPYEMHNAIGFASLLFGESATMASEAAVLGVPAIYLDNEGRGYTRHEEDFDLVYNYSESESDQITAIEKAVELIQTPDLKNKMSENRSRFLRDKINVTDYYVWFVENYPKSKISSMKKVNNELSF